MPGSYEPAYPSPSQLEGPPLPFRAEGPLPRRRGPLQVPLLPPSGDRQTTGIMPMWMGHAAGRGAEPGPSSAGAPDT